MSDALMKDMERAVEMLNEKHTEITSIRIFVTSKNGNKSISRDTGSGDFYSCMGAVNEWSELQRQRIKAVARAQAKRESQGDDLGEV
jgi:hypothetical protein